MRILILGGTSFFGKDIVRQFHEAGHDVSIFTRGNHRPTDLPPVNHIPGERKNPVDLARAAAYANWDIVVDNIAYDSDAVQLALTVFKNIKRYILCSTVSVYRFVRPGYPQPLNENVVDFSYNPPEEKIDDIHWIYARGKLEAERALIHQDKVPWTVLRPPVVYGPYDVTDRGFWYLGRIARGGPILLANGGAQSFRLVYSVDTAKSFLLAAETEKAKGGIYNIAQSEVITLKDFIEESSKALALKPPLVSVPFEFLGELAGPYATMTNLVPDISAAVNDLKFKPTPFAEFTKLTAHWYLHNWKGDEAKLFETRQKEIQLAEQWTKAVSPFESIG